MPQEPVFVVVSGGVVQDQPEFVEVIDFDNLLPDAGEIGQTKDAWEMLSEPAKKYLMTQYSEDFEKIMARISEDEKQSTETPPPTLTIYGEQAEALADVIELALGDQQDYLSYGSPTIDYEDEWPQVALTKATSWVIVSVLVREMGLPGLADKCKDMADAFAANTGCAQCNQPATHIAEYRTPFCDTCNPKPEEADGN